MLETMNSVDSRSSPSSRAPDLPRISRVENLETREALLGSEAPAQDLGTEARTSHAQNDDIGEIVVLDLPGELQERLDLGALLTDDVEPPEPARLVAARPQRGIPSPDLFDLSRQLPLGDAGSHFGGQPFRKGNLHLSHLQFSRSSACQPICIKLGSAVAQKELAGVGLDHRFEVEIGMEDRSLPEPVPER